ncbi:hypothetical protein ACFV1W_20855 [Kitasatospora sp. NPDC059648]|uniref:hypothetical protein n=1 Tax=Kitasatospora sp. NPDC059648 TaxID=3346894 RepID=UPI0036B702AC
MTTLADNDSLLPSAPQFWDVVSDVLTSWFGVGSVAATITATLIAVRMWYLAGREGYRAARAGGRTVVAAARFSARHLGRIPGHQKLYASLTTLAVLVLQALWLAGTYFFVSVLVANVRSMFGGAPVGDLRDLLRWGGVNGYYTVGCLLLLVAAYALTITGNREMTPALGVLPAVLPALSAVLLLLFAVLATLIYGLLAVFGSDDISWADVGFFWCAVVILTFYALSGFAAMGATVLTAAAWRADESSIATGSPTGAAGTA